MSTTPRTGQPGTAAAVQDLASSASCGRPEARYAAPAASHRINGTRKSGVPRVSWTPAAESDLQLVVDDPAVRDQLKLNAEMTLHEIKASAGRDRGSEGIAGEVMWHRGIPCGMLSEDLLAQEDDDGPWDYIVFYRRAAGPAEFEVLAVRGRLQIADRIWEQVQNGSHPSGAWPAASAAA